MNVLIVDDEPLARDRLKRMVNETTDYTVIAEASNGAEAIEKSDSTQPDVILMDIRMPEMDGLAAAKQISQNGSAPAIIFCTAYDDYGVEAFDAQAAGYLLKPVRKENLESALEKAQSLNRLQVNNFNAANDASQRQREHIASRSRRGIQLIPFREITVFKADHKYVTAYHTSGEVLIDDTLKDLETEFEGKLLRVHRNALVNIEYIEGLCRNEDGAQCLRIADCDFLPQVSRRHLPKVRKVVQSL